MSSIKKYTFHKLFLIGIIFKGIDGLLELIGGFALVFIKSDFIVQGVNLLFQHEIAQDLTDFIANYFIQASQNISTNALCEYISHHSWMC